MTIPIRSIPRRSSVLFLLLGITLAGVPARAAGSTPALQEAAQQAERQAADTVEVASEVTAITLPDIVVTAVLRPTAVSEAIRPSAVFSGETLQRQLAGTLAQTVESVRESP